MEHRDTLLKKNLEGHWLVASATPFAMFVFRNEMMANMFQDGFGLDTSFHECLGCEIIEQSDEEDSYDMDGTSLPEEEGPDKSYPALKGNNTTTTLWNNALWVPGTHTCTHMY
jgi:hypothetical protein